MLRTILFCNLLSLKVAFISTDKTVLYCEAGRCLKLSSDGSSCSTSGSLLGKLQDLKGLPQMIQNGAFPS